MSDDATEGLALGVAVGDLTADEREYVRQRIASLAGRDHVVIAVLLAAEINIRRLWAEEQPLMDELVRGDFRNEAELTLNREALQRVANKRRELWRRYDFAAIRLGLRRRRKDEPDAPIASLWLRYKRQTVQTGGAR